MPGGHANPGEQETPAARMVDPAIGQALRAKNR
jgi:hypothetical protein